jgi:hypothetical protein
MKSRDVQYKEDLCVDAEGREYSYINDLEDPWTTFDELNRALAVHNLEIVLGDGGDDFFAFRIEKIGS